eukprot:GHVS01068276.1.p1 GENE.GHVS01068276.1~~GHVS01068276.1.p1  ORF type:complete len:402 (+),score=77.93 GHVS01068276.1:307-1512(+)
MYYLQNSTVRNMYGNIAKRSNNNTASNNNTTAPTHQQQMYATVQPTITRPTTRLTTTATISSSQHPTVCRQQPNNLSRVPPPTTATCCTTRTPPPPPTVPAPTTVTTINSNSNRRTTITRLVVDNNNIRLPTSTELGEICGMVKELCTLDQGLDQLFSNPPKTRDPNTTESYASRHERLVVYRGRLARRVSRYSQVVKAIGSKQKQWSAPTVSSGTTTGCVGGVTTPLDECNQVEIWYQQHISYLQQYKCRLSRWWSETERHFHMLRMASFVSEVELSQQAKLDEGGSSTCCCSSSDASSTPPPTKLSSSSASAQIGNNKTQVRIIPNAVANEEALKEVCRLSNSSTVPSSRTSSIDSQKPSFVDCCEVTMDQPTQTKWIPGDNTNNNNNVGGGCCKREAY